MMSKWKHVYPSQVHRTNAYTLHLEITTEENEFSTTAIYTLSSNDICQENIISWDSNSATIVVDISANTHLWNDLGDCRGFG